jgi:hypothetical protein
VRNESLPVMVRRKQDLAHLTASLAERGRERWFEQTGSLGLGEGAIINRAAGDDYG